MTGLTTSFQNLVTSGADYEDLIMLPLEQYLGYIQRQFQLFLQKFGQFCKLKEIYIRLHIFFSVSDKIWHQEGCIPKKTFLYAKTKLIRFSDRLNRDTQSKSSKTTLLS